MDTDFIRDNISRDKAFADMQMSIVSELKEIVEELINGNEIMAVGKINWLISELEEDAQITYKNLKVLEGEKKWDYQHKP